MTEVHEVMTIAWKCKLLICMEVKEGMLIRQHIFSNPSSTTQNPKQHKWLCTSNFCHHWLVSWHFQNTFQKIPDQSYLLGTNLASLTLLQTSFPIETMVTYKTSAGVPLYHKRSECQGTYCTVLRPVAYRSIGICLSLQYLWVTSYGLNLDTSGMRGLVYYRAFKTHLRSSHILHFRI
jgi:hypothetical protein